MPGPEQEEIRGVVEALRDSLAKLDELKLYREGAYLSMVIELLEHRLLEEASIQVPPS